MSQEWEVPGGPVLRLTADELMLIDWVLCMYSHVLSGDLADYMRWEPVRTGVWEVLDLLWDPLTVRPKEGTVVMVMPIPDARMLLAILPTTHRWGTGFDCGFSLKRKLARYIRGLNTNDDQNKAPDQAPSSASDES